MRISGSILIANAIIWGVVLIGCALVLRGTPYKDEVLGTIGAGATIALVTNSAALSKMSKKISE
jgi:hypothetical protein